MFKLCTNENHSYKHNEQINNQNINNSECFGVKFIKNYLGLLYCQYNSPRNYVGIFLHVSDWD